MRIVVVSATSVIAVSCVRQWSSESAHEFELVGRSAERLEATASDLRIRFPKSTFMVSLVDFDSTTSIAGVVKNLSAKPIDVVLVAQGSLTDQKRASNSLEYLKSELELNAVSVSVTAEAFAGALGVQGFGILAVIGSVAGDRGRAYNYSYGSSKAMIETFTQGLQQRFGSSRVSVCLIKPGPTATPMTATHEGKMADPAVVAKTIVAGITARRRVIYAPGIWRLIMLVVRMIPFTVFKRLKF